MQFNWQGRNDGDDALVQRIFQRVQVGETSVEKGDFALQGFAVDEGVRRNGGRVGAAQAPDKIRQAMANFPVVNAEFSLKDFGNVECFNGALEAAQRQLAENVTKILGEGVRSIVLGGGHEVTWAHYNGIRNAFPQARIGIINIDAHFDNREPINGMPTSGTGFYQIAQQDELNSLHIGIQRNSNTLKLFDTAHQHGMQYILADEIYYENLPHIYEKIDYKIADCDVLYLTICMDVFNAAIAPGVSAVAYNGIFADHVFLTFLRHILRSEKLVAMDVAEVNPELDIQDRTARLAASLVNEWFMIKI